MKLSFQRSFHKQTVSFPIPNVIAIYNIYNPHNASATSIKKAIVDILKQYIKWTSKIFYIISPISCDTLAVTELSRPQLCKEILRM